MKLLNNFYIMGNIFLSFLMIAILFVGNAIHVSAQQQQQVIKVTDALKPLPQGSSLLQGYIGQKLDSCIQNSIVKKDYQLYIHPFALHSDDKGEFNEFQGEFWGKWFTSLALAYNYQPTDTLRQIMDAAVLELMKTQGKDGRLSSYSQDFGDWDIWGRKYALLGLIAYHVQTGNKEALTSACRALDNLISVAGPGKRKLTETGLSLLEGLPSSSILEPVALIYQLTGNQKYLDFARYLVSLWSEPNRYTQKGMRLIEDAIDNIDPLKISTPKGYEQMSCFEGLCELYRATGDKYYLNAVVNYAKKVLEKEIMIVGSGSSCELWCDGANRQTELLEMPMETCVTVTWIKLCYQLLRLTGDPMWADEMEITLYNSLLGAMVANGNWWAYFSPLIGERMPSPLQVPSCQTSCCVANGPRGLLTVPQWSVMEGGNGPVINIYTSGKWKYCLPSGNELELIQKTNYPKTDQIEITVEQKKSTFYTISLRIPSWSKKTKIQINDDTISCTGSGYFKLAREWKNGDKIKLTLDLRGRILTAPGDKNQLAIMRGPIVLALDNRFIKEENKNLWLFTDQFIWKHDKGWNIDYVLLPSVSDYSKEFYIDLKPIDDYSDNVWMAFEVPFLYRPTHFVNHKKISLVLCDYASAGNLYSESNFFRVWIPQPMFMNDIFPRNSWHLLTDTKERAKAPILETKHQ